jgi:hypothetical protein
MLGTNLIMGPPESPKHALWLLVGLPAQKTPLKTFTLCEKIVTTVTILLFSITVVLHQFTLNYYPSIDLPKH